MTAFSCEWKYEKLATVVRVPQTRQALVRFYVVLLQKTAKKCGKINKAYAQLLVLLLKSFFGDIFVALVLVVCLSSLLCNPFELTLSSNPLSKKFAKITVHFSVHVIDMPKVSISFQSSVNFFRSVRRILILKSFTPVLCLLEILFLFSHELFQKGIFYLQVLITPAQVLHPLQDIIVPVLLQRKLISLGLLGCEF